MKMNRVQFQPGLSMAEFMDRYGSDDQCEAALIDSRWPGGFVRPACGCGHSSSFRREGRLCFQCTACRHHCRVISGTIVEATKLGLSRWFLAMHLLTQSKNNVAALELMRHLGVCYKTAWLVKHKLMEVMRRREDDRQLDGRVEIDDAYLEASALAARPAGVRRTRCRSLPPSRPRPTASRSSCACASSRSRTRRCRNGTMLSCVCRGTSPKTFSSICSMPSRRQTPRTGSQMVPRALAPRRLSTCWSHLPPQTPAFQTAGRCSLPSRCFLRMRTTRAPSSPRPRSKKWLRTSNGAAFSNRSSCILRTARAATSSTSVPSDCALQFGRA